MENKKHRQVARLFAKAVELPAGEREAFLARECGDDLMLLEEVRSLLAHDQVNGTDDLALTEMSNHVAAVLGGWLDLAAGCKVSHYKILEKIGEGGMGVVYKAEDTKLKRTVALKFLPPELTHDKDAKTRFINEAQAASALQHHNICTIHEIDETHDGRLFISMDCYEGETLKEKISRGPLPLDEALDITNQIVSGLVKAHQAGMIHRDIKPANIIVTGEGIVKILDFGMAKLAGKTKVTRTGTVVGTVSYMSPEQAKGERMDARSDIFSVGVVLYELLAGEPPFKSDNEAATLYNIIHKDPEPLSTYRSNIADDMWRVVETTLAKKPEERYADAADLLKDLESLRQPGAKIRGVRKRGPRRRRIVATVAVFVTIGIAALVSNWQRESESPTARLSLAIVDFQDLVVPDKQATSIEISGLLHVGLVESSPIRVISPDYLHDLRRRTFGSERGPIEEDQVLEVARKSGATVLLSGQIKEKQYVIWRLVDIQTGESIAARRDEWSDLVELADRIIAEVVPLLATEVGAAVSQPTTSVAAITTDSPEAYSHYIAGVLAREKLESRDALDEFEAALAMDSTFALACYGLSEVLWYTNPADKGTARRFAESAWRHRIHLGIKDRMQLEAWREYLNGRITEAIALYEEILTRWPDDRQALKNLSSLFWYYGFHNENLSMAPQALELYPDDWWFTLFYANTLGILGKLQEALEVSRACADKHPLEARAWFEVGQRYYDMALPDSVEMAIHRALAIDSTFWKAERFLSFCRYCRGDVTGAIESAEQILTRDYLLDGDRIWLLISCTFRPDLPFLYTEAGQFKEAMNCFERAEHLVTSMEGKIGIGFRRAQILLRVGRAEEVLIWSREMREQASSRLERYEIAMAEAWALVALDSIETASSALTDLRELSLGKYSHGEFEVRARIALAEEAPRKTLEILREWNEAGRYRVGALQDIEYREMLADAHRMAGRLGRAAKVHEEMLRIYRGHFLSHYDLGHIYEEMGRLQDAATEYTKFLEMWSDADGGLPQVEDARRRLLALNAGP